MMAIVALPRFATASCFSMVSMTSRTQTPHPCHCPRRASSWIMMVVATALVMAVRQLLPVVHSTPHQQHHQHNSHEAQGYPWPVEPGSAKQTRQAAAHTAAMGHHTAELHSRVAIEQQQYQPWENNPACAFLRSGLVDAPQRYYWANQSICSVDKIGVWFDRVASLCHSCVTGGNVCTDPPTILYHQYLEHVDKDWEGTLLSFRTYLMTQDLAHTKMIVWTPNIDKIYTRDTQRFFDAFSSYIEIRKWEHSKQIVGTPWEHDRFLANETKIRSHMKGVTGYSNLVRIALIHNYGGLWIDNDVIFYQNLHRFLSVSYQFVTRYINNHVLLGHQSSPMIRRAMELATTLPMDHVGYKSFAEMFQDRCASVNVRKSDPWTIHNYCLWRIAIIWNNTGNAKETLYDLPIGWFDQEYGCRFESRRPIDYTLWRFIVTRTLTGHTRYPKIPASRIRQGSPLYRVKQIVDGFFSVCSNDSCLVKKGAHLIAYEGYVKDLDKYEKVNRLIKQMLDLKPNKEFPLDPVI